eukprot:3549507-Prymnesium_polylepis.1
MWWMLISNKCSLASTRTSTPRTTPSPRSRSKAADASADTTASAACASAATSSRMSASPSGGACTRCTKAPSVVTSYVVRNTACRSTTTESALRSAPTERGP